MASHNELGKLGENIAREFLISKGMTIREQNWRMEKMELDIVAEELKKGLLHIVEVKTRTSDEHYNPIDSINLKKRRNLIKAANGYIHFYNLRLDVQFDLIIIIGTPDNFKIDYIPKAFEPPLHTYR